MFDVLQGEGEDVNTAQYFEKATMRKKGLQEEAWKAIVERAEKSPRRALQEGRPAVNSKDETECGREGTSWWKENE